MQKSRRQKIHKKRRRRVTYHLVSLEGKMAKGKKNSKAKGKAKSMKLAPVEEATPPIIPIAKQLSRNGVQYIQLASVVVESDQVFRSVTKEITKESQRPASGVIVPGLGRMIPIPGSQPVTTPLCKPQCSGTNVPVCYPPDPCCPLLEKELYLDTEPEKSEESIPDIAVQGYNPKPPKIVLGVDGEPKLESDSDCEIEDSVPRLRSPPIVHSTPPRLMQKNEFLYHVNVIGEDGVLEVDRLDENHPLPNCRLREIEIDKYWMQFFPGGNLTDTCCSEVFEVKSMESMDFMREARESLPLKATSLPELEELEEYPEPRDFAEPSEPRDFAEPSEPRETQPRKSEDRKTESRKSEPRKSSPRKSSPRMSSPRKSSPRLSSPRKSSPRGSSPRVSSPRKSR